MRSHRIAQLRIQRELEAAAERLNAWRADQHRRVRDFDLDGADGRVHIHDAASGSLQHFFAQSGAGCQHDDVAARARWCQAPAKDVRADTTLTYPGKRVGATDEEEADRQGREWDEPCAKSRAYRGVGHGRRVGRVMNEHTSAHRCSWRRLHWRQIRIVMTVPDRREWSGTDRHHTRQSVQDHRELTEGKVHQRYINFQWVAPTDDHSHGYQMAFAAGLGVAFLAWGAAGWTRRRKPCGTTTSRRGDNRRAQLGEACHQDA